MSNKPFAYKIDKPKQYKSGRRENTVEVEQEKLDYFVRGERASKPEYWLAGAWDILEESGEILSWVWQPSYITFQNVPGEIRLDFMVKIPPDLPVFLDGRWIHKSAGQQDEDKKNDARLNARLSREGAMPVVRIPSEPWVTDEDTALRTARMAIAGEQFIR